MDAADLAFAGIERQAQSIATGDIGARQLLEVYLERIGRLDGQLNAFRVVLADQARAEADRADERRGDGERLPLLGVPIAVKDDIDVAGEITAMGTRAHAGPVARDAEVVRRLRSAGAVIIGKTNVPELCIWPFTETTTWGFTRNPWSPQLTPGGSSGGSAAAVAAGLVGAALGSDGAGSIRIPAAWCGLFGLKPQRDRVPMAPREQPWHGLSVIGVLTRSPADSALFHDAVAGAGALASGSERPLWNATQTDPGRLRIALSTRLPPGVRARLHPRLRAALEDTVELLRGLGHEVDECDPAFGPGDGAAVIARYLRGIHDDAATLAHPERLERRTRTMARAGGRIPMRAIRRVRAGETRMRERVNAMLDAHDVLLTPAAAQPPPPLGRYEGRGWLRTLNGVSALVPYFAAWNATGQPACSVPAGFDEQGLPCAVQLVGRPDGEASLLALAAQLERARPWQHVRPAMAR